MACARGREQEYAMNDWKDMAVACGCMRRPDTGKGSPTKLKWWWMPVIAAWLYVVYRIMSKLLSGPHGV